MVRTFILNKDQRDEIAAYLAQAKIGNFEAMSPQMRQLRLRSKRLHFDEMVADLNMLKALASLPIPKGRIGRNLHGKFYIRPAVVASANITGKIIVNHPQEYFEAEYAKFTPEELEKNVLPIDWLKKAEPENEPSAKTSQKSSSD